MSGNYVPLYRKYRPQTLDTLVGQEHIKKALASAIELRKISHAFLFTGPRGTGKTSTARILAKSLNCENGPTLQPCGKCESCKDITNSIPLDVIEIDAASNRKVEDAQNILEKIQYVPVHGKYKIYIIDEVHMLSNTAFNALLKTLEEPPENVIFILATTEVHKVLDTIKSRCQRYDFRRITTDDIVKHLRYISNEEKINISDDALYTIATNSAGGMRDSISLLDQLSLLGVTKEITSEDVNAILGRISFDILYKLSDKIISSSPNEAIEILSEIYNSGNEPLQILTNLAEYFKNLLIVKNCKKDLLIELTGLNEQQIEILIRQKELLETHQIVSLLERITYYIKEVKMAVNQHLWLEVGMIDFANLTENTTLFELQNRIKALECGNYHSQSLNMTTAEKVTKPIVAKPVQQIKDEIVSENKVPESIKESVAEQESEFTPPPMSKKLDANNIQSLWEVLLANIKSVPARALLKQMGKPIKITKDEIIITLKNENFVAQYSNTNKKDLLVEAANVMFNNAGTKITVRLPLASDNQIISEQSLVTNNEKYTEENMVVKQVKEINENKTIISKEENKESKVQNIKENKIAESDQEKMILDLFDGKYVE